MKTGGTKGLRVSQSPQKVRVPVPAESARG
jgi:hypothetical protein